MTNVFDWFDKIIALPHIALRLKYDEATSITALIALNVGEVSCDAILALPVACIAGKQYNYLPTHTHCFPLIAIIRGNLVIG